MFIIRKTTERESRELLKTSIRTGLMADGNRYIPFETAPTHLIYTPANVLRGAFTLRQEQAHLFCLSHLYWLPGLVPKQGQRLLSEIAAYVGRVHPGPCRLRFCRGIWSI